MFRPESPNFSSGPCAKRPGYDVARLDLSLLGRSHRSAAGRAMLKKCATETARLLGLPADYRVAIVPASDTGAMEMALWSLLGARGVDMLAWESFGQGWITDVLEQLKLEDVTCHEADYGQLPDLRKVNFKNDVVFTWNGTTSGVCVPDGEWIAPDREGLTICDATSAVFAMELPWKKLDVVTFSWQKVLGGEAGHGMLILSPRAVERLQQYTPPWPLPKIFRMTTPGPDGKNMLNESLFEGNVINTPSLLCAADYLDALAWCEQMGGVAELIKRSRANLRVINDFVLTHAWAHFLAEDPATRSNTSVCLKLDLSDDKVAKITELLAQENIAYDIAAYKNAPAGLRIWCGATVSTKDLEALMLWLAWAYMEVRLGRI